MECSRYPLQGISILVEQVWGRSQASSIGHTSECQSYGCTGIIHLRSTLDRRASLPRGMSILMASSTDVEAEFILGDEIIDTGARQMVDHMPFLGDYPYA